MLDEKKIQATGIIPDADLAEYLSTRLTEAPLYADNRHEVANEKRFKDLYDNYKARQKKTQDESNLKAKREAGIRK